MYWRPHNIRLGSSLKKMVLCLVVLCQAMVIMLEESVGHYMPFCFNFEAGFFFLSKLHALGLVFIYCFCWVWSVVLCSAFTLCICFWGSHFLWLPSSAINIIFPFKKNKFSWVFNIIAYQNSNSQSLINLEQFHTS